MQASAARATPGRRRWSDTRHELTIEGITTEFVRDRSRESNSILAYFRGKHITLRANVSDKPQDPNWRLLLQFFIVSETLLLLAVVTTIPLRSFALATFGICSCFHGSAIIHAQSDVKTGTDGTPNVSEQVDRRVVSPTLMSAGVILGLIAFSWIPYLTLAALVIGSVIWLATYKSISEGTDWLTGKDTSELVDDPFRDDDIRKLQDLELLMDKTLRYHQLEILCRYGDYLAERLGVLRSRTDEKLAEHWTDTSRILRQEEGLESAPYHKIIQTAAQGLGWDEEETIFMVHEYAKRNNLMHAELFQLVEYRNWQSIGDRCEEDINKLRDLVAHSDSKSKAALQHWESIIMEFRDRWVCRSEHSSHWVPRSIIEDAISARISNQSSLSQLAKEPDHITHEKRKIIIDKLGKENKRREAQRNNERRKADKLLQKQNKQLEEKIIQLEEQSASLGAPEHWWARTTAVVDRLNEVMKENERCKNRITQLEEEQKRLTKSLRSKRREEEQG
ncbi:hypothetical protein FDECE_14857 [Fusarium decemcellulare]|nr:hypothetical protein FDECE_14857 [Fusarium decemcellulare]